MPQRAAVDEPFDAAIADALTPLDDVPELDARQKLYHLAALWDYIP